MMSNQNCFDGHSFQMAIFVSPLHIDVREVINDLLMESLLFRKNPHTGGKSVPGAVQRAFSRAPRQSWELLFCSVT